MMLAPFHALTAAEVLHGARSDVKKILDDFVCAGKIHRPVRVGEAKRLLFVQVVLVISVVVFHM